VAQRGFARNKADDENRIVCPTAFQAVIFQQVFSFDRRRPGSIFFQSASPAGCEALTPSKTES